MTRGAGKCEADCENIQQAAGGCRDAARAQGSERKELDGAGGICRRGLKQPRDDEADNARRVS